MSASSKLRCSETWRARPLSHPAGLKTAISHPTPKNRVHFRHVRDPQDERIGDFDIVVTAHRLVDTERAHEPHDRRCHAMACIGVDVIRAESRFHQFVGRVPFPDRHCPEPNMATAIPRPCSSAPLCTSTNHHIECLFAGHRDETRLVCHIAHWSCATAACVKRSTPYMILDRK